MWVVVVHVVADCKGVIGEGVLWVGVWESGCRGRCIVASSGVCGRRVAVVYKQRMAIRVEDRWRAREGWHGWSDRNE